MSHYSKRHIQNLFDQIDECCDFLQNGFSNFVMQVKTKAMECLDNSPGCNMTVKEAIAMVTTAHNTLLEHMDMLTESTQLYPTPIIEAEAKISESKLLKTEAAEPILKTPNSVEFYSEITSRLEQIELTLTSLQDSKQKTEDDISEIKQWKDNFVTEQNDMGVKVDQLSKKQKQNFKNMRKQLNDYEDKLKKSNLEVEYLQEKELFLSKTLEKLSLDMKENESNLNKLNKEMQLQTDKTSVLIQEIKSQTDLMADLQEEQKKRAMHTENQIKTITSTHGVTCQLLQQRLVAMDKLFQMFNQNLTTRDQNLNRLDEMEHKLRELSLNIQTQSQPQVKPSPIGFEASLCRILSVSLFGVNQTQFKHVERNEGNHFDPNTGVFTAPVDGLYKASFTIKQTGDQAAQAFVVHKSGDVETCLGNVRTTNKSVEASSTFEFRMKTADVLYIQIRLWYAIECTHFSCFLIDL